MGGVVSAVVSANSTLLGVCEKNENPAVESLGRRIEERAKKERKERHRKEREEREREKREMEAREENLRLDEAVKEMEIRGRVENEAAIRKEYEKKEADLMRDFYAKVAAIQKSFAEQLAALQLERETMEAKMKREREREREDEKRKAMRAQENLQQLQRELEYELLRAEKDQIEENWKVGITRPTERITKEEFLAVKVQYEYQKNMFHIAIVGTAGAGKSSLVNAFLGVSKNDPRAARTDIVQYTEEAARYPGKPPLVWYVIPGAGILDKPGWQYFNQQGLYIFDCIIVLFDTRLTETDASILQNCRLVQPPIPTFIVRTKSDQHIDNEYKSRIEDEDEDDLDAEAEARIMQECIEHYVERTRTNVRKTLQKVGLDENQRVYLVSQASMRAIMNMQKIGLDENQLAYHSQANIRAIMNMQAVGVKTRAAVALDESDLIHDILSAGCTRRGQQP